MSDDAQSLSQASGELDAGGLVEEPERLLGWAAAATPSAPPPDAELAAAVRTDCARLLRFPPETLLAGLDAVLCAPHPDAALRRLEATGVLGLLLPEVQALVDFHSAHVPRHKDLWDHTLQVVVNTVDDPDLRWAALMHDVGKVATRCTDERRRVSFWRHELVSAWLMRGVGARLAMPPERLERISFVVEHHARVNAYEPAWSDKAVRRLVRDGGRYLDDLLAFSGADVTTRRTKRAARIQSKMRQLTERIRQLHELDVVRGRLPRGLGNAVSAHLGIDRGPAIGEAMEWLRERVTAGELPPDAPEETYLRALAERD